MVNINLVPEKIRAAESLRLVVMVGVVCLTIPVFFWAWRYQGKRSELAQVEKSLQALNDELASPSLQQVVKDVEQFTKDQSDLDSKRSVVDELRKRQVLLLRLLDMLPDVVPRDARVNSLVITEEKGVKKVELICDVLVLDAVAALYENLEASPLVEKLVLDSSVTEGKREEKTGRILTKTIIKFDLQDKS